MVPLVVPDSIDPTVLVEEMYVASPFGPLITHGHLAYCWNRAVPGCGQFLYRIREFMRPRTILE